MLRSLGTIYAAVQKTEGGSGSTKAVVALAQQNRGEGLTHAAFFFAVDLLAGLTMQGKTRKKPNCFNLLHQLKLCGDLSSAAEQVPISVLLSFQMHPL